MLEFSISNQLLTRLDNTQVFSKSLNYLTCHFVFSQDWEGAMPVATFGHASLSAPISVPIAEGVCVVPHEVIAPHGFTLSIFGSALEDGTTTHIPTSVVTVEVALSGAGRSLAPVPPTPTLYDSLLSQLKAAETNAIAAKTAAAGSQGAAADSATGAQLAAGQGFSSATAASSSADDARESAQQTASALDQAAGLRGAVVAARDEAEEFASQAWEASHGLRGDLNSHVAKQVNPHKVTYAQVGALPMVGRCMLEGWLAVPELKVGGNLPRSPTLWSELLDANHGPILHVGDTYYGRTIIRDVAPPLEALDAANKAYVDAKPLAAEKLNGLVGVQTGGTGNGAMAPGQLLIPLAFESSVDPALWQQFMDAINTQWLTPSDDRKLRALLTNVSVLTDGLKLRKNRAGDAFATIEEFYSPTAFWQCYYGRALSNLTNSNRWDEMFCEGNSLTAPISWAAFQYAVIRADRDMLNFFMPDESVVNAEAARYTWGHLCTRMVQLYPPTADRSILRQNMIGIPYWCSLDVLKADLGLP